MAISTHKMLANSEVENKAQIIDQASTLSGNTKNFFDCSEPYPVSVVSDVVGSLALNNATSGVTIADGSEEGNNVSVFAPNNGANITGGEWDDPGANDYIIIVMGKSVDGGLDIDDNGSISFYFGDRSNGAMRVQPYYAAFFDDTDFLPLTRSNAETPFANEYRARVAGEDYMFAGLKSGNLMQHYAQGKKTGEVDVVAHHGGYLSEKWKNQAGKGSVFQTGHSSYGVPNTCDQASIDANVCEIIGENVPGTFVAVPPNVNAVTDTPQDLYGILFHVFPNGAPSQAEIEDGLAWMQARWLLGKKVIYPGWMF